MKIYPSIRSLRPLAVAAMLAGAFAAGCGTEPNPEPPIHTPGTGSAYNFTNYSKDSNGMKVASSETHTTRTILGTNATVQGKSGVIQFLDDPDTVSMHYEANGDVMLLQPAVSYPNDQVPVPPGIPIPNITIPARWITFGLGSKSQQTIPTYDTTVSLSFNGFPIGLNVKATGNTTYIGTEDVAVGAEKIATQKGLLTVNVQLSAALLFTGTFTTTDTVWFAPKLGMFIKEDGSTSSVLPAQFGPSGVVGGNYSILTSYTMK